MREVQAIGCFGERAIVSGKMQTQPTQRSQNEPREASQHYFSFTALFFGFLYYLSGEQFLKIFPGTITPPEAC